MARHQQLAIGLCVILAIDAEAAVLACSSPYYVGSTETGSGSAGTYRDVNELAGTKLAWFRNGLTLSDDPTRLPTVKCGTTPRCFYFTESRYHAGGNYELTTYEVTLDWEQLVVSWEVSPYQFNDPGIRFTSDTRGLSLPARYSYSWRIVNCLASCSNWASGVIWPTELKHDRNTGIPDAVTIPSVEPGETRSVPIAVSGRDDFKLRLSRTSLNGPPGANILLGIGGATPSTDLTISGNTDVHAVINATPSSEPGSVVSSWTATLLCD